MDELRYFTCTINLYSTLFQLGPYSGGKTSLLQSVNLYKLTVRSLETSFAVENLKDEVCFTAVDATASSTDYRFD